MQDITQAAKDFVEEISNPTWTMAHKAPLRIGITRIFQDAAKGFADAGGIERVAIKNIAAEVRGAKEAFDRRVKFSLADFDGKEDYMRQVMNSPKNQRSGSAGDAMASKIQQICRSQAQAVNLTPEQAKNAVETFVKAAAKMTIKLPVSPGSRGQGIVPDRTNYVGQSI